MNKDHKLILVCWPIWVGKSVVAQLLSEKLQAVVLRADELRKQLFPTPTYSSEETTLVIQEMYMQTEQLLATGQTVILDALFSQAAARAPYALLANQIEVPFIMIVVETHEKLLKERVNKRSSEEAYFSDATRDTYLKMKSHREAPQGTNVFFIDNNGTLAELERTVHNIAMTSTLPITSDAHVFEVNTDPDYLVQALASAHHKGYKTGVCAKIHNDKGEILLLQRGAKDYFSGVREMPGGGVEVGETIEQAVLREVSEETGLQDIVIHRYLGYFDFPNPETGAVKRKFCFEIAGTWPIILEDHDTYAFFPLDDLPLDQMYAGHRNFLAAL